MLVLCLSNDVKCRSSRGLLKKGLVSSCIQVSLICVEFWMVVDVRWCSVMCGDQLIAGQRRNSGVK